MSASIQHWSLRSIQTKLIKVDVMHCGGYKASGQLRPFFLGLIVGDAIAGAIWIVVGFVTGKGYRLLPG